MKPEMVKVNFYLKKQMHDFLRQLCKDSGMDMSEMMRSVISYFFMAYTLGQWNMPMQELRDEFVKFINEVGKTEKRKRIYKNIKGRKQLIIR